MSVTPVRAPARGVACRDECASQQKRGGGKGESEAADDRGGTGETLPLLGDPA